MATSGDGADGGNEVVAVLGAGYVGLAVAQALPARGRTVYAVRRGPLEASAGVRPLSGDAASGRIPGLPARVDRLVLAVAPGTAPGDDYWSTYVGCARGTLALAERHGARSVVYTSSTGVYGGIDGRVVDEGSPLEGHSPGSDALIAAERVLLDGPVPATVLRLSGIYGPGRSPLARFRHPETLPRRGEYWVNFVHRDDVASAVALVVGRDGGAVLNCSDGTPARAIDVALWLAEVEGRALPAERSDDAVVRSSQRVSSAALQALGWRPRHRSYQEGFRTLLG